MKAKQAINFEYETPIRSREHAEYCKHQAWILHNGKPIRDVYGMYHGKLVRDKDGILQVEDKDGIFHTDDVLRALSRYTASGKTIKEILTEKKRLIRATNGYVGSSHVALEEIGYYIDASAEHASLADKLMHICWDDEAEGKPELLAHASELLHRGSELLDISAWMAAKLGGFEKVQYDVPVKAKIKPPRRTNVTDIGIARSSLAHAATKQDEVKTSTTLNITGPLSTDPDFDEWFESEKERCIRGRRPMP